MKKLITVAMIAILTTLTAYASNIAWKDTSEEQSYPSYINPDDVSNISNDEDTENDFLNQNTSEVKMRKKIYEENEKVFADKWDKLDDKNYEKLPIDIRNSEKYHDAEEAAKNESYNKVMGIIEKYSGYKVDETVDNRREVFNELIETCCSIINEESEKITLEEKTRLIIFLEDMYHTIVNMTENCTERDQQDAELIKNTITLPY